MSRRLFVLVVNMIFSLSTARKAQASRAFGLWNCRWRTWKDLSEWSPSRSPVLPQRRLFSKYCFLVCLLILFLFFLFTSVAYGGFQARGGIGAAATGLYHSQGNTGSKPHLQQCWILNPLSEARDQHASSWILVGFLTCWTMAGTPKRYLLKYDTCEPIFLSTSLYWGPTLHQALC